MNYSKINILFVYRLNKQYTYFLRHINKEISIHCIKKQNTIVGVGALTTLQYKIQIIDKRV